MVVGLGNHGRQYQGTRHNVAWEVLASLARRHAAARPREKFQGEQTEVQIRGQRALLVAPLTYMNRSGDCVAPTRDFYKLDDSQLLVVCDDISLPLAKLRFRAQGSAGGQRGLQHVLQRLGTQQVARLRIGVGQPPAGWDAADYVLGKFTAEERPQMDDAVQRAATAVEDWLEHGTQHCMNQYNGP